MLKQHPLPQAHVSTLVHGGIQELHLLEGKLWIDRRKLFAGATNTLGLTRETTASGAKPCVRSRTKQGQSLVSH